MRGGGASGSGVLLVNCVKSSCQVLQSFRNVSRSTFLSLNTISPVFILFRFCKETNFCQYLSIPFPEPFSISDALLSLPETRTSLSFPLSQAIAQIITFTCSEICPDPSHACAEFVIYLDTESIICLLPLFPLTLFCILIRTCSVTISPGRRFISFCQMDSGYFAHPTPHIIPPPTSCSLVVSFLSLSLYLRIVSKCFPSSSNSHCFRAVGFRPNHAPQRLW